MRSAVDDTLERVTSVTVVAGLAMLAVFGMVFAIARATEGITSDAATLHSADEVLRSATVVRAQLTIGVHAGTVDAEFGTDSTEVISLAVAETEQAMADVSAGLSELGAIDGVETLVPLVRDFTEAVNDAANALSAGDYSAAQTFNEDNLESAHAALVGGLVGIRDRLRESVDRSDQLLGLVGTIAGFLVAVLIPSAVILVYRALMRRQARQTFLESRLEAEQHLSRAREEFVANASHELRTPLTSITGLALLLEEDRAIASNEILSELVGLIADESTDLSRMVEDMLTTARLDVGALSFQFEDVSAESIVGDVVESMRASSVEVMVDCRPGTVRCDPARLRQIVRNLVSNACKYGDGGVWVWGAVESRTYVLEVVDRGPGVPAEIEDRLFQRFVHRGCETATSSSVGLGLSIVRSLADGMGGTVTYHRRDGETCFSVRLPLGRSGPSAQDVVVSGDARASRLPLPEVVA
ncbi:MAG TPA: HAMP domain-containing sensor histidine kinase [Acidimicrobiia bacterium]